MARPSNSLLERSLSAEVLYGRADHLRVFVSSKMRDGSLRAERRAAVRAINAQPWHRAWAWETNATAGPYSARRVCIDNAATSDALVLILADDLTPITKSEYLAAKRAQIPRFILVKAGVLQSDVLARFVSREQARQVITVRFRNLRELETAIHNALRAYAVRSHRVVILKDRGEK
jgi:hypothetical protein